jgi:hypothetical protein
MTSRPSAGRGAQLGGDGTARVDMCAQCLRREEESAAGLGLAVEVTPRGECRVLKVPPGPARGPAPAP